MTEITQADRDTVSFVVGRNARKVDYEIIARHREVAEQRGYLVGRQEERAAIVAWLRKVGGSGPEILADAIEAGSHLKWLSLKTRQCRCSDARHFAIAVEV